MTTPLPRRNPVRPPGPTWVVHLAGPPSGDGIQACAACGATILDNRRWFEGRVAVPEFDAGRGPSWWPVGDRIGCFLGSSYIIQPAYRLLDPYEQLCPGAN